MNTYLCTKCYTLHTSKHGATYHDVNIAIYDSPYNETVSCGPLVKLKQAETQDINNIVKQGIILAKQVPPDIARPFWDALATPKKELTTSETTLRQALDYIEYLEELIYNLPINSKLTLSHLDSGQLETLNRILA